MSHGEHAGLEGVLSQVQPTLAIQIGGADPQSVERVASHSTAVHGFALGPPRATVQPKITSHAGNSRELLPLELKRFSEAEQNVDFVLVARDGSDAGIRRDVEDLLNSEALGRTIVLIHETTNETVRDDLDGIHFAAWPKVAHVDLDFIPGRMFREGRQLRGGLGLITVDSSRLAYTDGPIIDQRYYSAPQLFAEARSLVMGRDRQASSAKARQGADDPRSAPAYESSMDDKLMIQIGELETEILRLSSVSAHHEALWRGMMTSVSWKSTAPLRTLATLGRRVRRA
jgi:hypothetical protein